MKRLLLLCLFSLPLGAQVVIQGGSIIAGGSGGGPCPTCALTNLANTFTQTNTFPSLSVTNGVNGLPLYENTGLFNIGAGVDSTPSTATGIQNLGIGDGANQVLTTGYDNTSIGVGANGSATTAAEETAIGTFACQNNISGVGSACIGSLAGADFLGSYGVFIGNLANGNLTTGDGTIAIGAFAGCGVLCSSGAGPITSLSNGIYIGYQTGASANSLTNQLLIGYNIQSSVSNYMQLGNSSITTSTIYGVPTFPSLGGSGSGCIGISNAGLTSTVACGSGGSTPTFQVNGTGLTSSATINFENGANVAITNPSAGNISIAVSSLSFANVGAATNTNALVIGGTLSATGGGTISATSAPFSGIGAGTSTAAYFIGTGGSLGTTGSGTIAATSSATATVASGLTGSPAITVSNVTDSALTPGDCVQAGTAGILVTTGSACGAGGGSGPTVQTNGVNNASQSNLNFTNTATVLFTNPSVGIESATVPTATSGAVGVSNFDNTTIGITSGALHVISPGNSTLLGFNSSGAYTGFTLGTNLSFAAGVLNATGIAGTLSTTNCIPKQSTSTSITCSSASDNGTVFSINDSGGLQVTGTIPGVLELASGTGAIPALPSNSYGDMGPLSGGTPYLRQHPNTAAAGIEIYAAPTTINSVNAIQSTFMFPEGTVSGGAGAFGTYTNSTYIGGTKMINAGQFVNIEIANVSAVTCTTAPTFNLQDTTTGTNGTTPIAGSTTGSVAGTKTNGNPGLSYNAGDEVRLLVWATGTSCPNTYVVNAQYQIQ